MPETDRIKHLNDLIEFPKEGILSKTIHEGPSGEADLFMLPKGSKISSHTSARDAAVLILQGEAEFTLGDTPHRVRAGISSHGGRPRSCFERHRGPGLRADPVRGWRLMALIGINQDTFHRESGGFPPFEEMIRGVAELGLDLFEFCPDTGNRPRMRSHPNAGATRWFWPGRWG